MRTTLKTLGTMVENNAKEMGLLPGARRFIEEVEKLKVAVVYLSNRAESKRAFTIQALALTESTSMGWLMFQHRACC